ncbi:MFS general substrate transporter [Suillus decipiens]|nr:MFS general substrate transporter [Suillus decipiens]
MQLTLLSHLPLLFKACFIGSTPIACGGGVISDIFSKSDHASTMAVYFVSPLIGPMVGPVIGGFIAELVSIQNVFYVIVRIYGVIAVLGFLLMRESYAPVIQLCREQRYTDLKRAVTVHPTFAMNKWAYLWMSIEQPIMIMTYSFMCFMLSLYMALIFSIYYMMFTTFPDLFSDVYHFSIGIGHLSYIRLGIGLLSTTIFGARICNKIYLYISCCEKWRKG